MRRVYYTYFRPEEAEVSRTTKKTYIIILLCTEHVQVG